jgi:hypothetical protein
MASPSTRCLHSRLPEGWHGLIESQRPGHATSQIPGRRVYSSAVAKSDCRRRDPPELPPGMQRPSDSAPRRPFTNHSSHVLTRIGSHHMRFLRTLGPLDHIGPRLFVNRAYRTEKPPSSSVQKGPHFGVRTIGAVRPGCCRLLGASSKVCPSGCDCGRGTLSLPRQSRKFRRSVFVDDSRRTAGANPRAI